jgi:hypothetical protein
MRIPRHIKRLLSDKGISEKRLIHLCGLIDQCWEKIWNKKIPETKPILKQMGMQDNEVFIAIFAYFSIKSANPTEIFIFAEKQENADS